MDNSPSATTPLTDTQLSTIREHLIEAMPGFLGRQRWFADKHRQVTGVELTELIVLDDDKNTILLTIAAIQFADGERSRYFIPLLLTAHAWHQTSALCAVAHEGKTFDIVDAIAEPAFHRWLLRAIRANQDVDTEHGRIECRWEHRMELPVDLSGKVAGVEQSNSSILIGDSLIAKVYRRVTPGTNPDVEVGTFLTRNTSFTGAPALVGSVQLVHQQVPITLVMVQEQLSNPVDSWTHLLDSLQRDDWGSAAVGLPLGAVTAQLHLALASGSEFPEFAPTDAAGTDIATWKTALEAGVDAVSKLLVERLEHFDHPVRQFAENFLGVAPVLRQRAQGFESLTGLPLIRVHGDYHLGQVLRLPGGRLSIVDFEGEPQRPIDERRLKTSPLKDVAGMLRSFSYGRGATAAGAGENRSRSLLKWEQNQRRLFIAEYRRTVSSSRPRLIPEHQDDFNAAITAWEIDKALYEVEYELSSRPGWLWLPLSSLVALGE